MSKRKIQEVYRNGYADFGNRKVYDTQVVNFVLKHTSIADLFRPKRVIRIALQAFTMLACNDSQEWLSELSDDFKFKF